MSDMIEDHNDSLSNLSPTFEASTDNYEDDDEEFEDFDAEHLLHEPIFDEANARSGVSSIDFDPCDSQDDLEFSEADDDESLTDLLPGNDENTVSRKTNSDSPSTDQIPKQILQQLQLLSPEMQKQMLPQILATLQVSDIPSSQTTSQSPLQQETPTAMDIQGQDIPNKNMQSQNSSPFYTSTREPHQAVSSFPNSTMPQGFQSATPLVDHTKAPSAASSQMMESGTFPLYPVQEIQNQIQQLQVSNGALSSGPGPQQPTTAPMQYHHSQTYSNDYDNSGEDACILENNLDHLDCNAINAMKSSIEDEIEKTQKLVQSQQRIVKSQLNVMEKLSESMKRSAMSRNMVNQLSGRSIASDGSASDSADFVLIGTGGPQGSSSSLSFRGLASGQGSGRQLGSSRSLNSSSGSGGRGFGRPIAVSGRGRSGRGRGRGSLGQRENSWRNISNGSDIVLDGKLNPSSRRPSGETMYSVGESGFERSIPDRGIFKHHSNPTVMTNNSVDTIPAMTPMLMTRPGRGLRRSAKSNPHIGHQLQRIERGAMDVNYDGLSDAGSV
mmetsp:Transcript_14063/g.21955  ORF Transcript_14063/g.21955 Transcript_14063/m.21955 type:complete len:554 (+) Transcript_14063:139-1800(+)